MLKKLLNKILKNKDNREISMNIVFTFIIKGLAMLITVLIVPAYTRYFANDNVYGAWLTVSSVFLWINMFDFGIGNGLRNYLVKSLAENDDKASKKYISSAYVSVGVISLVFLVLGCALIYFLNWNSILKISAEVISPGTFRTFILIMYTGVVVHFFFLLVSSICYALQKTFLPGLISLITHIMLLLFLYIPNSMNIEGKIISLSVSYLLSYNIPILAVTLWLFFGKLKEVKPSFKFFDKSAAKQVVGLGGVFFLIQIALIALNSSNEIYINAFFNASDVVQYTYYHKMFYVLTVLITLFLQPIWSAVTKAYCERRFKWVLKMYWIANAFGAILCLGSFLLAAIYQPLADIWLGKGTLVVQPWIAVLFAIHTSMYIISNTTNSFSNGFSKLKCQTICTISGAILKLLFVVFAVTYIENASWSVVMLSNIVALIPLSIVHPIYIYSFIKKSTTKKELTQIKDE